MAVFAPTLLYRFASESDIRLLIDRICDFVYAVDHGSMYALTVHCIALQCFRDRNGFQRNKPVDTTPKAIETEYKGYRFRSRLEARWAVFLDSFGEEWQYEVEGYELPSGRYLPDFWLPRLYCWLEIKGVPPTPLEIKLCEELAFATDKPAAMAWGLPVVAFRYFHDGKKVLDERIAEVTLNCPMRAEFVRLGKANPVYEAYKAERLKVFCFDETDSSGGNQWWDESFWAFDKNGKLCICSNNSWSSRTFGTTVTNDFFPGMLQIRDIQGPIGEQHVNKAKSARFEFQR